MAKKAFRAESGLDSGGHLVRNVATPSNNNDKALGLNVEYFIRENTVQKFDPSRSYKKYFAVTHQRRLYIAKIDVPVRPFNKDDWDPIRVDPNWIILPVLDPVYGENYPLKSGDYISASSEFVPSNKEMRFILPDNPIEGDTIVIKDEGYFVHSRKIVVKTNKFPIEFNKTEELFTIPGSMKTFIFSDTKNGQWIVHTSVDKIQTRTFGRTATPTQLSAGDNVFLDSGTGRITMQLPRYASDGDIITAHDLDGMGTVNGIVIQIYPGSGHKIVNTLTSYTYNSSAPHHFIYDASNQRWDVIEDSQVTRIKEITGNYSALPRENVAIVGGSGEITITLPKDAARGDYVRLSNFYKIVGLNVKVQVATGSGHKILGNTAMYAYPKYRNLPNDVDSIPRVDFIEFTGNNLGAIAEFYYNDTTDEWKAVYAQVRQEHVDEQNRTRPGVAPLATQAEVNNNSASVDDKIVTPKLLANRIATESLRGIAEIATIAEAQSNDNHTHIVTPKGLYNRTATESRRGVAEIATQAEANSNDNDTHIITAKKLNARRATVSNAGVVKIITTSATAAANRSAPGTGVYNWADAVHNEPYVLTPKTLNQAQATENSRGVAYIATQSEANTQDTASDSLIVTPKKLDKRRALETLHGIGRLATQAEANAGSLHNSVFITPKTLHGRQATESMWGLTENATQAELNAGTDNFRYITPLKFKTWMGYNHFVSDTSTGIEHGGQLWDNVTLKIRQATETQRGTLKVADQNEANAQGNSALDTAIITPKKLDARRSTELMAGIAEIATQSEVDAKSDHTRIVTPETLGKFISVSPTSNMTESQFGTGTSATMAETWVGNTTIGSERSYMDYDHNPYVVTPRGLNYALRNYLPKTAKAVDSDKLDNLDSTQFIRSDVDDDVDGNLYIAIDKKIASQRNKEAGIYFNQDLTNDTSIVVRSSNSNDYGHVSIQAAETGATTMFMSNGYVEFPNQVKTNAVPNSDNSLTNRRYVTEYTYSKGESDSRFVNVTGDTMTGTLRVENSSDHIALNNTDTNTNWNIEIANDNTFQIDEVGVGNAITCISGGGTRVRGFVDSDEVRVNNTVIIESDEKINWDKLKGIPDATTTYKGIVQLTDSFSSPSTTLGATASVIKVLKDMIDEKADITGAAMDDLKIKHWLQIGNVILRPNKATKSLDFIWTDVL